ncbi:MAG: type IV toxin-antitoxin system AbiEi family antitoxin domain-containing protein [Acidimicrobiia bacterium]
MWDEARVRELAGTQHGLMRRADLVSLGATGREIGWRIGGGRVDVPHPGVYYLNSTPPTWKTAVLAAVMAAGPDALASHRCAAVLWGFDAVFGRLIEVTVPYVESPEPDGVIVHRTRRPNPAAVVESIPITTPERTLFDIAPILPARVLEKAGRSAVHLGLATVNQIDKAVAKFGGRGVSGTKRMRWLVGAIANDQSGSVSEIDLKHIIWDAPIPPPVQQLQIRLPDNSNAYPDFSWPYRSKIVEVDGFGTHGSPEQLQSDLRRQNALMELGWQIRRFTATEIRDDPNRVRTEIIRFINGPSNTVL